MQARPKTMPVALRKAIKKNDVATVRRLVARKGNAEYLGRVDRYDNTPLLRVIKYKHYGEMAKLLIEHPHVDLQACNYYDHNAWSLAYCMGGDEGRKFSLTIFNHPRFKFNPVNKAAAEVLYSACNKNDMSTVKMLLDKGMKVEQTIRRNTPLDCAIGEGHTEIALLLLQQPDVDVNKNTSYFGDLMSRIKLAVRLENTRVIKAFLLHPKIEERWLKECNHPDIQWMVRNFSKNIFSAILVMPMIQFDYDSGYPKYNLQWLFSKTPENIKILLNFLINHPEFDINQQLWNGETVLTYAIKNLDIDLINTVCAKTGFDVNATNNQGQSPLIIAAYRGLDSIVKSLLALPVNPFLQSNASHTALTAAAAAGHDEVVTLLMVHQTFDFKTVYQGNQTILMLAAGLKLRSLVELILRDGCCEVNAVDDNGNSALHHAVMKSDDGFIVEKLLNYGANPLLKNNTRNYTPEQEAIANGHAGLCPELNKVRPAYAHYQQPAVFFQQANTQAQSSIDEFMAMKNGAGQGK